VLFLPPFPLVRRRDQSESFSVHGLLLKELGSENGLNNMGSLMSTILSKREELGNPKIA
jgi:hypothetical protein